MTNKKGYLQISFGWLFAIIVGIVIISLAIFFVTKMFKTEGTLQSAKTSKEIGILLNPLETSFESAITSSVIFPEETRIYNTCDNFGYFGTQGIEIMQKSFNKWAKTNLVVSFQNKYIFSERYSEGKKFYIFSKPFEFPFKVANLMYITSASTNYCFIDAPEDIEDEISDLKQPNLRLEEECSEEDVKVCFGLNTCEIEVDYDAKKVEKDNQAMYFETDALMYAAIFSDKATYECQLKRLMQRIEQLSLIYMNKANSLTTKGCDPVLNSYLSGLIVSVSNLKGSNELYTMNNIIDEINEKNRGSCRLW